MNILIDGKKYSFKENETILEVCKRNGINIPTLCFNKKFPPNSSCFVCIVEDLTSKTLIPSCSTNARDGMKISTDSDTVKKYRRMAIELLLSEHDANCFSPCKVTCPAGIDVRDYIMYQRNSDSLHSFLKIRKKNPFVTSIGRVCPARCENDCSRNVIDQNVDIRLIKRFVGDDVYKNKKEELLKIEKSLIKEKNDMKVAIIGGGPSGLSAAYYFLLQGSKVEIFEREEFLGGMLRYSIPSYRLPKDILKTEIDSIINLGVKVHRNFNVDEKVFKKFKKDFDKVVIATGTWKDSTMRLGEENYENSMSALEFLKKVNKGDVLTFGKRVVVVGGGNSAIDSARTLLRLGLDVSLIYRRTKKEMPALEHEITDAINEGVKLIELLSPNKLIIENDKLTGVSFEKMVLLDEKDQSGRNKIKGTGRFYNFNFDTLIYAIGQKKDNDFEIKDNVYICGDALTGASTAIEAIASGKKLVDSIFNNFNELSFCSKREDKLLKEKKYEKKEKEKINLKDFKNSNDKFVEVEEGLKDINFSTQRCIDCGCEDIDFCKLRDYSIKYGAKEDTYKSKNMKKVKYFVDDSMKYMTLNQSKCVKCGTCINVCEKEVGASAINFINRGLDVKVAGSINENLKESDCIMCGMCIDTCPTGAISESINDFNWNKGKTEIKKCDGCILECNLELIYDESGRVARVRSHDTPICAIGRWGNTKDYKNLREIYKGKINNNLPSLEGFNILELKSLSNFSKIYVLDDPKPLNPRMTYEMRKLKNLEYVSDINSLVLKSNDLVILNYFNLTSDVLEKLKNVSIFPFFYRKKTRT
jgi:formate dehydrogenase major subunit